jgi:broad specificity phosphatase PhoE
MQHLYFIRHGQSEANAQQLIAGSHDSPLSPVGRLQAAYAGETAKLYYQFDLIVSSPMSRALETAHIIADKLDCPRGNILIMDDLRERNLGAVEGKDYRQTPHYDGNYEDAENIPGVEPIAELMARLQKVLSALRQRPERHILVVAHNGSGRMLKVAAKGQEPMAMYSQPRTENAVIYHIAP